MSSQRVYFTNHRGLRLAGILELMGPDAASHAVGVYGDVLDLESLRKAADEIVARCMIPMVNEIARCLEEKIVSTPYEADMALIYGIGFPPFRGGACRYVDQTGATNFVEMCDKYASLGKLYEAPKLLRDMAASGRKFFA